MKPVAGAPDLDDSSTTMQRDSYATAPWQAAFRHRLAILVRSWPVVLLLHATASGSGHAQVLAASSGSPGVERDGAARRGIEMITVTGSLLDVEASAPAHETHREEFLSRAPLVLTDALRAEPGVHLQSTTTGQGSPYLRGLTGSAVLTVVDGMRLNHAIYRSAPNPYLALVDPGTVDALEIVRGPSSVLYGSDSMGGVIRVMTRHPEFESEAWESRARFATRLGSADHSGRVRADLEIGRRGLSLGMGLVRSRADHLRGGDGRQRPTAYESEGGDFRLLWRPAPGHATRLNFQFLRQPSSPRHDQMAPGFGQTEPSSDEWFYEPLERLFAHASHAVEEPVPGAVDALRVDVSFQRIRDDRRTRSRGSLTRVLENNESALLGFRVTGVTAPTDALEITWGSDAYLDEVSSERQNLDLLTGIRSDAASRFPDGSSMGSYGVFARADLQLGATWRLNAGLRYSYFDTRVASTSATRSRNLHLDDLTGSLGFLWTPADGLSLATNLRRGFRAPNIFDMGTLGERPGNRFNVPSADLGPEEIYSADLGIRLDRRWGQAELFVFASLYDDKILSSPTGEVTPDGRDVVQSRNTNRVRLAGAELSLELDLREDLSLLTSAMWIWGDEEDTDGRDQPADRVPPLQGRIGLLWRPTEDVWAELYARLAVRQGRLSDRDLLDPRIDPRGTDAWATASLRGGWRLNERWSATLELQNLSNASYREHGSGVDSAGFGVVAQLEVRF